MISKLPLKKWLGAHSSPFLLFTMIAAFPYVQAQMHVNGKMYIASGSAMYVSQGNVTFGTTAELTTQKRLPFNSLDGRIILGGTSVFVTDGTVPKFVNGYAATTKITSTLLATGSTSVYAPVMVVPSTNTGVQAAYFNQSPTTTIGSTLNQTVREIANTEFWIVKGAPSILTLSWRSSSNLSGLVFPDVVIVGYKNGAWEEIPSAIDSNSKITGIASSLNGAGTITSLSNVNLNDYSAFAIGEKGVSCAELIASSESIKIWNGTSWTGGTPTLADPVQLNADYTGGSFVCNSINFNGFDVVLTGTDNLELVNGTSGSGKIVMSSESSLVQRNSNATVPQIELTKTTRPIKRFDYVYWGSPIAENAFSQLNNAYVSGNPAGAFDLKYKYISGILGTGGGWQNLTETIKGQGFIMRVKEQIPFVNNTYSANINLKFTGTANNGNVTIPVTNVAGNSASARNNNLVANPYPSAIDVDKFLTENNSIIDGAVYIWRANTTNTNGTANYAVADYLAHTKAGTSGYAGTTAAASFNGKIASGQGFKVRALTSGNVKFTNCMRVTGNNDQFFRSSYNAYSETNIKDRYRVKLDNEEGEANQILIAYLPETTLEYDNMYDAQLLTNSNTNIYSILDNTSTKLAINARPEFVNSDQVTIGFRKNNTNAETLKISIQDKEGLFASELQAVYLFDNLLNVYHDFANGAYEFTTNEQENNTRFKIVYQNGTLGNDDFNTVRTFMKLDKQNLSINSENNISKVYVYDITGRLILEKSTINASQNLEIPFVHAEGVYIVKVKLETGAIVTSKLINKN